MSLKTWKEEFYPVLASDVAKADAAAHSLKKWEGALKENLKKHGVVFSFSDDEPAPAVCEKNHGEILAFNAETCALCVNHYSNNDGLRCRLCPLAIARGGMPCDEEMEDEQDSPWSLAREGDPKPMIHWLKIVVAAK